MSKLIARYQDEPTVENARKIRAYEYKHPMAICMLSADEYAVYRAAIAAA